MNATTQTCQAYVFENYDEFAETETGNEVFLCNIPIYKYGNYIKTFNVETFFPATLGGGNGTWGCDISHVFFPTSGVSLRDCLGGGGSNNSLDAGLSCSRLDGFVPSSSSMFSARLCSD